MILEYEQRNGEADPPTDDGWFWFGGEFLNTWGKVDFRTDGVEVVHRTEDAIWISGENRGYNPEQCRGKWWGPILFLGDVD